MKLFGAIWSYIDILKLILINIWTNMKLFRAIREFQTARIAVLFFSRCAGQTRWRSQRSASFLFGKSTIKNWKTNSWCVSVLTKMRAFSQCANAAAGVFFCFLWRGWGGPVWWMWWESKPRSANEQRRVSPCCECYTVLYVMFKFYIWFILIISTLCVICYFN